jgi:hypothetical protein
MLADNAVGTGVDIPEANRSIIGPRDELACLRRPSHAIDDVRVPLEPAHGRRVVRSPEPDRPLLARRGEEFPVVRPGETVDRPLVLLEGAAGLDAPW